MKKIRVTEIDLDIDINEALILRVGSFRFIYEKVDPFVSVEDDCTGGNEWLEDILLDYPHQKTLTKKDLERIALNWIFKNVEIVSDEEMEEIVKAINNSHK